MVNYKDLGLVNTREMFKRAVAGGYAIPAFNFNTMEQMQAIVQAAVETKSPVIMQVSKGARNYANATILRYMAEGAVAYAKELGCAHPEIVLHLDHGDSFELCKDCIDMGFSSVMYDGSSLPYEENIKISRQVVEYAHKYDVTVECELGVLAGVEDEVVAEESLMMKQKSFLMVALLLCCFVTLLPCQVLAKKGFVHVEGTNLIQPNGERLFIVGTNLGNWLNPEGYMFGFSKTNSAWMIDLLFKEAVGPDEAASFWREFKDNYITQADIDYIKSTGANTIRLPFNYKLFTNEDYMGLTHQQDGFKRIDQVVDWCRKAGLYLILDMHDCPGSQTGDNIDDGYGYPWLFESEPSQQLFCNICLRQVQRGRPAPRCHHPRLPFPRRS